MAPAGLNAKIPGQNNLYAGIVAIGVRVQYLLEFCCSGSHVEFVLCFCFGQPGCACSVGVFELGHELAAAVDLQGPKRERQRVDQFEE